MYITKINVKFFHNIPFCPSISLFLHLFAQDQQLRLFSQHQTAPTLTHSRTTSRPWCLKQWQYLYPNRKTNVSFCEVKWSRSVVSDSSRPHGVQPIRLLCPRDFPGRRTGVGCQLNQSRWTQNSMSSYISKECLAFLLQISIHSTNIYLTVTMYRLMGGYENTWQGIFYFSNTRETAMKCLKAKNS